MDTLSIRVDYDSSDWSRILAFGLTQIYLPICRSSSLDHGKMSNFIRRAFYLPAYKARQFSLRSFFTSLGEFTDTTTLQCLLLNHQSAFNSLHLPRPLSKRPPYYLCRVSVQGPGLSPLVGITCAISLDTFAELFLLNLSPDINPISARKRYHSRTPNNLRL